MRNGTFFIQSTKELSARTGSRLGAGEGPRYRVGGTRHELQGAPPKHTRALMAAGHGGRGGDVYTSSGAVRRLRIRFVPRSSATAFASEVRRFGR